LYGGVGLGKTHLGQAIAWELSKNKPEQQIVYITAERFMYLFVRALQQQAMADFKTRFRSIDTLVVDDVQFITGKEKTQKEFFHTFDALMGDAKQLVLICDKAPANLENLDEKLKSRMNGGLVVDIGELDYQLRLAIICKKSQEFQLGIEDKTQELLARHLSGNCRDIEGCLKRLLVNKNILQIEPTSSNVEKVLRDGSIFFQQTGINIGFIQKKVAEYFGVAPVDLRSKKKLKKLVLARHIAMYLARMFTDESLATIAGEFSGKSHAAIVYAINHIRQLKTANVEVDEHLKRLTNIFEKMK
jgi:chromosomal replication initiator protein